MQSRHFLVTGKVQGVYFRVSTQREALRLGLRGWVRNLADGRVEVVACGDAQALAALQEWLWRGPERALVESVQQTAHDNAEPFERFDIR